MRKKRRLLLTIPFLNEGGAQRVIVMLANHWATQKKWEIALLTYEKAGTASFYALDKDVHLLQSHTLGKGFFKILKRIFSLRRAIHSFSPECIVSFLDVHNITVLLSTLGSSLPVIVSERTNPMAAPIGFFKKMVRNLTYRWADKIIVQTKRIERSLPSALSDKTQVIPNPVMPYKKHSALKEKTVIAAGRLSEEKDFQTLIEAFAQTKQSWKLVIWGEGSERENLEQLICEMKLTHRVSLPGRTKNIAEEMAKGSIFVLSSKFEGMPNALAEAMSLGLSVISTDCPTGPRELITDGEDGLLVPVGDVGCLADALNDLMENEELRKSLGQAAIQKMKQYDIEIISQMWEKAFDEAINV